MAICGAREESENAFRGGEGGGGWSTYGTRDQTYLEEKIRLEGAAINVAEERIPAPIRPSFVLSNEN